MIKTAANNLLILLLTLTLAAASRAALTVRELAAEGSADRLWVAEVVRPDALVPTAERTRVYWRAVPSDGWQHPMLIGAGLRDVAHRGTQLVATLTTGEWMFLWPDGRSSGPALPGDDMLCVGGDGNTLYAVGRVPGGMKALATTRPTTEPAAAEATTQESSDSSSPPPTQVAATTAPSTAPTTAPVALVLFHLDRSTWVADGDLPDSIPAAVEQLSIESVHGRIYVAALVAGEFAIYDRTPDGAWSEAGRIKPRSAAITRAKILDGGDRPILWLAGATGGGALYLGAPGDRHAWSPPIDLRVPGADLSQPLPRDLTVVAHRLQMVFAKGDDLFVQAFDWRTGEPYDKFAPILAANGPDTKFGLWLNAIVMTLLLMVMLAAMRRRGDTDETILRGANRLALAPLTLRFAAAAVDMWPQWLAAAYLRTRVQTTADFEASLSDPMTVRIMSIAFGVYLLHTLLTELFVGASVGKLLFGLRVVLTNGDRPPASSMFVRNLLRAIDAGFIVVGLVMIAMSPLRQRTGDLAAGTIVVRKTAVKTPDPQDERVNAANKQE